MSCGKSLDLKGLQQHGPLTVLHTDMDEEGSFDAVVVRCDYAFLNGLAAPQAVDYDYTFLNGFNAVDVGRVPLPPASSSSVEAIGQEVHRSNWGTEEGWGPMRWDRPVIGSPSRRGSGNSNRSGGAQI